MTKQRKIDIAATAEKLLGFPSLRAGQEEAVQALLGGEDAVVVQPTGSGKSAIYQIAGELLDGATVIVSPLIALQKDQADSIEEKADLQDAAIVNSAQPVGEQRETLDQIEEGAMKYIFLAPEQLRKRETIERLRRGGVSLFVVDEAHCVSQWGHDFRPDYLQLSVAIEALGHPPVLAMTATASSEVRAEITERLGLHAPRVIVHGFDRPNISLRVDTFSSEDEKRSALLRRVAFAETPGIVYVATHKNAEDIAGELKQQGVDAVFYHGGLKAKERDALQDRFIKGDAPVIVATNAFGMGIDKPDIRFVYHADVSESLDSYYQEVGRAGRDGEPAEAVLFFRARDLSAQRYKSAVKLDTEQLEQVAAALKEQDAPASAEQLAEQAGLSARKLINTVHRLEEVGAAEQLPSGEIQLSTEQTLPEITEAAAAQQEQFRELHKERLQQMENYAECRNCRREVMLRYFGEAYDGPCGNCDNCESAGTTQAA